MTNYERLSKVFSEVELHVIEEALSNYEPGSERYEKLREKCLQEIIQARRWSHWQNKF